MASEVGRNIKKYAWRLTDRHYQKDWNAEPVWHYGYEKIEEAVADAIKAAAPSALIFTIGKEDHHFEIAEYEVKTIKKFVNHISIEGKTLHYRIDKDKEVLENDEK